MSEFLSSHELLNLEEELKVAEQVLYVQKSGNEGLVQSLKSLTLRTGWAAYLWIESEGLMNLKSTEPPPPKTKVFKEAVQFALARKHFSVFIFPINTKEAWLEAKLFFSKYTLEEMGAVKFLFILPKGVVHPFFVKAAKLIDFSIGLDGNYVLRDGHWINANELS